MTITVQSLLTSSNFALSTGGFLDCRDDLEKAIYRAREVTSSVEINLHGNRLYDFRELCLDGKIHRKEFSYLSVHAPAHDLRGEAECLEVLLELQEYYDRVVQHPNLLTMLQWNLFGKKLLIENMDHRIIQGQSSESLQNYFERYPQSGFCLDLAHTQYIDPSGKLAKKLATTFADRLKQCHLSVIDKHGHHSSPHAGDLFSLERDIKHLKNDVLLVWEELPFQKFA
jgi:hypothetical protein